MAFGSVVALPLTRREMEVADLVRDGLTNREIAARLFLSERTVEGHVAQICSKLGVRSRLQIATWVLEQEGRQPSMPTDQVSVPPAPPAVARRRTRARLWIPVVVAVPLALGAVVAAVSLRTPARPQPPTISTYQAGLTNRAGWWRTLLAARSTSPIRATTSFASWGVTARVRPLRARNLACH